MMAQAARLWMCVGISGKNTVGERQSRSSSQKQCSRMGSEPGNWRKAAKGITATQVIQENQLLAANLGGKHLSPPEGIVKAG